MGHIVQADMQIVIFTPLLLHIAQSYGADMSDTAVRFVDVKNITRW